MTAQRGIQLIDQLQNETRLFLFLSNVVSIHDIKLIYLNFCRKSKQVKNKIVQERKSEFMFDLPK